MELKSQELSPAKKLSFREFIEKTDPKFVFYEHIAKLIAVLQRVADGEITRLMVFEPPRHGKSELISRKFSAYYLYLYPERWVAITSYAAKLAYSLSRSARAHFTFGDGELSGNAAAVEYWMTGQNGGLWAAGVGGSATGFGYHLGIIDDPLKDAEEANSEVIREKHKDWYRSVFSTREEPGGAIIIVNTRWNEDDLVGWLLAQETDEDGEPERWHIVNMPAIAEEPASFPPTCTVEPDDRKIGEPLCPERYPLNKLQRLQKRIGEYFWGALFQQRPRPKDGEMFKRQWFKIVKASPTVAQRVRYWDKAGTDGAGAFTCGALLARGPDKRFCVENIIRGQWSAGEREAIIRQTAELDRQRYGPVAIVVEQEPGSGGKESAENTIINMAGFNISADKVTGDKVFRAEPFAAQCQAGNVDILEGEWNSGYLDRLTAFPKGKYKDDVDASSGAFNKLALGPQSGGLAMAKTKGWGQ